MRWWLLAFLVLTSCGGETGTALRFQTGLPGCPQGLPGLQAKVQLTGGQECPLLVKPDRSVEGVCPEVPAGSVVQFRLVYYVLLVGDEVPLDLATAMIERDLSAVEDSEITLVFSEEDLNTTVDDDQDGVSNLEELCQNRNPRGPP